MKKIIEFLKKITITHLLLIAIIIAHFSILSELQYISYRLDRRLGDIDISLGGIKRSLDGMR